MASCMLLSKSDQHELFSQAPVHETNVFNYFRRFVTLVRKPYVKSSLYLILNPFPNNLT